MIALLCAVPAEAEMLQRGLERSESTVIATKTITQGMLAGRRIALCAGGIGKVNAAHAATLLITRHQPEALIIFGIGGAYRSSGARIGDIALATEETAGDDGVLTPDGHRDMSAIGIPLLRLGSHDIYSTYAVSEPLFAMAQRTFSSNHRCHSGRFVTVSTCTGTDERADDLDARYHALCENMEGTAAAHVAMAHQIPWLELRGISNIVQRRDPGAWDISTAISVAQQAVLTLLEGWQA